MTMPMSISAQIVAKFGPKADDSDILKKCEELINIFGLTVEDLFLKWESYVITTSGIDNELKLTVDNLNRLQQNLQQKLIKSNQKTPSSNVKRPVMRTPNMSIIPSTPIQIKKRKLEAPPSDPINKSGGLATSDTSFATAVESSPILISPSKTVESGKVLETLNAHIQPSKSTEQPKVKLFANFNPQKYKFRTMNQKLLEVADYLDEQIDSIAKILLDYYKFDPNDFGNPSVQSQNKILTVGRITPDSPLTPYDADLNSNSLFLETSRSGGIGQRIQLNLSSIVNYSFFPGQIVCFKGVNSTGEFFKVMKNYELPYLGSPVTCLSDLDNYYNEFNGENMKIVITSGPYTTNKEINFDHLTKFVEKMNNEVYPNTIVMFGPFLDVNHQSIINGDLKFDKVQQQQQPKTLDEVFKLVITPILKKLACQVILIPSTKDATIRHAAYPQDSFDRKSLGLPKNFKCFPNPATFQLNEVLIGCSNNDILKDLKDVNSGTPLTESRFDRVVKHVLEQRRYYPVFPGGLKQRTLTNKKGEQVGVEHISGSDLHIPYLGLAEFNESLPDMLVLPSELKFFSKIIKNVLIINPGSFIKMNSLGSYCLVNLKAPQKEDLLVADEDAYLHNVWKRARVDIIRS